MIADSRIDSSLNIHHVDKPPTIMSEVVDSSESRQPGVRPATSNGDNIIDDVLGEANIGQTTAAFYVAPSFRVEELRDEVADDMMSGSSLCGTTDDECVVSAGDVSDQVRSYFIVYSSLVLFALTLVGSLDPANGFHLSHFNPVIYIHLVHLRQCLCISLRQL